ncbi:MAG: SGNH/GDSL hydrolase family protein [Verrucomicrobiae bacterium]|nr:SGNH/GDSL hydrolase family protein [Verrucomicrobiae bacterium]
MDLLPYRRNRLISNSLRPGLVLAMVLMSMLMLSQQSTQAEDRLQLLPGQNVVIAGNTFAERMALYGYFETALYCAYPMHHLTVRNLGWSGDEVDLMPRADNTGSFEENLGWHMADVVILCFGMNESFAGKDGLEQWRMRLGKFVSGLKSQKFNGSSAPKLVLVSPISHEDLGAPMPTGKAVEERNAVLKAYTKVMAEVAASEGILFVDLFEPMTTHMAAAAKDNRRLTVNGIHLNERGYYHASRDLAEALGLISADIASTDNAEALRRAVHEKNYLYHLCWRPLNPYYIWGGRAWCWEDDQPMDELEQIGALVQMRDEAIWKSEKPSIGAVWGKLPQGAEIWEQPVLCSPEGMPAKGEAPRMESVRRNGARPKP